MGHYAEISHLISGGGAVGIMLLAVVAFGIRLFGAGMCSNVQKLNTVVLFLSTAGFITALTAALTGYFGTWHSDAVLTNIVGYNKVVCSLIALTAWGMFLVVGFLRGAEIWQQGLLRIWAMTLVGSGVFFAILLGSLGGIATTKGTLLEPLYALVNPYQQVGAGILLIVPVVMLIAALIDRNMPEKV